MHERLELNDEKELVVVINFLCQYISRSFCIQELVLSIAALSCFDGEKTEGQISKDLKKAEKQAMLDEILNDGEEYPTPPSKKDPVHKYDLQKMHKFRLKIRS